MKIGVLAIQGAFIEHEKILKSLGVEVFEIRKKSDLQENSMDGLILPGGESTTMGKLLHDLDIFDDLKKLIQDGLPTFGTCAGMIILAKEIENDNRVHFGLMDIKVKRNAYGRQLGSFFTENEFKHVGIVPMTFIRAPYIDSVSDGVEVLASVDDKIVAARYKNQIGLAFHPELTDDTRIHEYFLSMVQGAQNLSLKIVS